jgi:hypothetical protein
MEEGMEVLTPLVVGVLVAFFTGVQIWISKGRFDLIDKRFEQVDRRFEQVERRLELLSADMTQLRADLLQVALASRPHPQTG